MVYVSGKGRAEEKTESKLCRWKEEEKECKGFLLQPVLPQDYKKTYTLARRFRASKHPYT